jgi:hypothetical protein
MRQYNNRITSENLIFLRPEPASKRWFHTEDLKQISAYEITHPELCLAAVIFGKAGRRHTIRNQSVERMTLVPNICKVRIGDVHTTVG